MSWSAAQYTKFEDERNRPVHDLLARIPTAPAHFALDAGCGPGNSTELLRARFPGAIVRGMDSSPDMIAAARKRLPDLEFEIDDLNVWNGAGSLDVILANAVFHWMPDHAALLPRLVAKLGPGGSLAVQVPDNLEEPAHRLMRETAAEGPWAQKLANATAVRAEVQSPEWYYQLLRGCCTHVDIWRTTYFHILSGGAQAIVEWFKGTGLRPFMDPLNETERTQFLSRYRDALKSAYPELVDGTVVLRFPRLFFVAVR